MKCIQNRIQKYDKIEYMTKYAKIEYTTKYDKIKDMNRTYKQNNEFYNNNHYNHY